MTVLAAAGFLLYRVGLQQGGRALPVRRGAVRRPVPHDGRRQSGAGRGAGGVGDQRGARHGGGLGAQSRHQPASVLPGEVARPAGRRDRRRSRCWRPRCSSPVTSSSRPTPKPTCRSSAAWRRSSRCGGAGGDRVVGRGHRRADRTARCSASRCSGWCCTGRGSCCRSCPSRGRARIGNSAG